jgi:hypothetical protein
MADAVVVVIPLLILDAVTVAVVVVADVATRRGS